MTYVIINSNTPLALSATELRQRLGISRSTLYRLVKQKILVPLPHLKRNRLFSYESVLEFLKPKK